MHSHKLYVLSYFLLLALQGLVASADDISAINLIKNPGFEEGDKKPEHWPDQPRIDVSRFSRDAKVFHSGKAALKWKNTDPKVYQMQQQMVPLTPGRRYELSGWIKTKNLRGPKESGATLCLGFYDKQGEYVKGGPHPGGQKGTRDWWQLITYTGPIPENILSGKVTCYVRKNEFRNRTFTGEAWWDDLSLRPVSFWATMLRPSYKRIIDTDSPKVEYEFECWPEDFGLKFDQICVMLKVLDAKGEVVFSKSFDVKKRNFRIAADLKMLKPGTYKVISTMNVKKTEKQLWSWEHEINRLDEAFHPEVKIDLHGRLIRNGKAMFPLGVYVRKAPIRDVKELGFNCFMSYDALTKEQMDKANDANLGVIYSLKDYYNKIWYCKGGIGHVDDEVPAIIKEVDRRKTHPALIAWYVNDELGPAALMQHRDHYEALNKADPDHPAWSVHCKTDEVSTLTDTCDIIGMDTYPVSNLPLSSVGDDARETLKQVRYARPMWSVIQIFDRTVYGNKSSRAPSLEEMRCMAWQAICEGAQGLFCYSLHDMLRSPARKKLRENVKQMIGEISEYTDILLSVEKTPEVKVVADKWLRWTARVVGNKVYVFAVSDGSSAGDAVFCISDKVSEVSVMDIGSADVPKAIKLNGVSWEDTFEPMQVKIYTIILKE